MRLEREIQQQGKWLLTMTDENDIADLSSSFMDLQ